MSKTVKWILALMLALSVVIVARASLQSNNYLPVVYKNFPVPTVTLTPTPTITPTPTKTHTPTKTPDTPCLSLKTKGVCITDIDYEGGAAAEVIRLKNLSSTSQDMKNWRISSDSGNKYDITFAFSLSGGATVKIWTKSGDNDTDDLYMDREEQFWNDHADCAYLVNDDDPREKIDSICYREDEDLGLIFFQPPATSP